LWLCHRAGLIVIRYLERFFERSSKHYVEFATRQVRDVDGRVSQVLTATDAFSRIPKSGPKFGVELLDPFDPSDLTRYQDILQSAQDRKIDLVYLDRFVTIDQARRHYIEWTEHREMVPIDWQSLPLHEVMRRQFSPQRDLPPEFQDSASSMFLPASAEPSFQGF
jgi:hypothetical protein